MLKIWLTWLQPSLGVLGTALVLSNPLCSTATPKPTVVSNTNKTPTQTPKTIARFANTTIGGGLQLNGIAATPDLAVRQLAIDAMATKGLPKAGLSSKFQPNDRDTLATFLSPSVDFQQLKTKATKPKLVKQPSALKLTSKAAGQKAIAPIVPGLFIGNSDVNLSGKFLPVSKPLTQPVSLGTEIGAPTPLSAMMAGVKPVNPFPVVRPEQMQKLANPAVAVAPTRSLDPIATVPTGIRKQTVQSIAPLAAPSPGLYREAPRSLDPIADIPAGLQRLLGNNLDNQPSIATKPLAKAVNPKTSATVALKQLVTPVSDPTPGFVSGASLQLATAEAYKSVPKFSIPGEPITSAKLLKPIASTLIVNNSNQSAKTAVVSQQSNLVTLMGDRRLGTYPKQSWTVVGQHNHLGGLILGSPASTDLKTIGLLPMNVVKSRESAGLPPFNLTNIH